MKILLDLKNKRLLIIITCIFLLFLVVAQSIIHGVLNEYKRSVIKHDYKVAGYLNQYIHKIDEAQIIKAFTSEENEENIIAGQKLLSKAGYELNTSSELISNINELYLKYSIQLFIITFIVYVLVLTVVIIYLIKQNKRYEEANAQIEDFINGDVYVRLNDYDEGSLFKLFTTINNMVTSLATLVSKEKNHKTFLKEVISDISHQLKTPLAALQMYNEIMIEESDSNKVIDDFLKKSNRELERIENLINNLLKLAKFDAGTILLNTKKHDLHQLLHQCIQSFKARAMKEEKSIEICCHKNLELDLDKDWIIEAISNIIKNAMDHTTKGNSIMIDCEQMPLLIQITISDNGEGIHPKDIHHIFKRFYRSRFSKDSFGVGIGLTLTKTIIEKHGGSIVVESQLDEGTKFTIAFPNTHLTIL